MPALPLLLGARGRCADGFAHTGGRSRIQSLLLSEAYAIFGASLSLTASTRLPLPLPSAVPLVPVPIARTWTFVASGVSTGLVVPVLVRMSILSPATT